MKTQLCVVVTALYTAGRLPARWVQGLRAIITTGPNGSAQTNLITEPTWLKIKSRIIVIILGA